MNNEKGYVFFVHYKNNKISRTYLQINFTGVVSKFNRVKDFREATLISYETYLEWLEPRGDCFFQFRK